MHPLCSSSTESSEKVKKVGGDEGLSFVALSHS
jgi:hypothetical protein